MTSNLSETSLNCVRIIEDDPIVLDILDRLVTDAGFVTRLYVSAEQFMADTQFSQPGCVLVDLKLPGLSGVDFADWMQRQVTPLPTIILTGYATVPAAVQCLKHGVFDFLEKPINSQLLIATVRRAVDACVSQQLANEATIGARQRLETLSDREKQVLMSMSQGLLSKQIASQLTISERTVEKHRASVMKKMQADSLAALLRMLIDLDL